VSHGPIAERGLFLAQQGLQFSSNAELQRDLPIGFLEVLELPLILLANIFRLRPQSIFQPGFALLDPFLDLRRRQIIVS
jgi:hypothetical protein